MFLWKAFDNAHRFHGSRETLQIAFWCSGDAVREYVEDLRVRRSLMKRILVRFLIHKKAFKFFKRSSFFKYLSKEIVDLKVKSNPKCLNFGDSFNQIEHNFSTINSNESLSKEFLSTHSICFGPTGFGKTASFMLPQLENAVKNKETVFFIDPKGDSSLINSIYSICVDAGREDDFVLISLAHPESSSLYNPLGFGSMEDNLEKIVLANEHSEVFYKKTYMKTLRDILQNGGNVRSFNELNKRIPSKTKNIEGLVADITNFNSSVLGRIFGSEKGYSISDLYRQKKVVLFVLASNKSPESTKRMGKVLVSDLRLLSSHIQNGFSQEVIETQKVSIFVDEFVTVVDDIFTDLINKVRSANFRVVLATQSISDLDRVSSSFADSILSNCFSKCSFGIKNINDSERFAVLIGTKKSSKKTKQTKSGTISDRSTGMGSERETDEFIVHPNKFRELDKYKGYIVTSFEGLTVEKVHFRKRNYLHKFDLSKDLKKSLETLQSKDIDEQSGFSEFQNQRPSINESVNDFL